MQRDWMHAAFGQRALGGFELQLESEWVDGSRSSGQLTFNLARQDTAVQQSTIRCLGRVIASVMREPRRTFSVSLRTGCRKFT
jgi:hypothetical protein